MLTPKSHHFLNSTAVNHQRLRVMAGEPSVLVAPVDADARGLADGQLVCPLRERLADGPRPPERRRSRYAVLISNWWTNDFRATGQRSDRPGAHGPRWRPHPGPCPSDSGLTAV